MDYLGKVKVKKNIIRHLRRAPECMNYHLGSKKLKEIRSNFTSMQDPIYQNCYVFYPIL